MKLFNRSPYSSSAVRPATLGRSSQAGITLIDLAIVFAVVAVVGAPSAAAGLVVAALCVVFVLVALAVLSVVRVAGFLLRRKHREAES